MKLFYLIFFSLFALYSQDQTILTNSEILGQARKAATEELKNEITIEKVAAKYKIPWPAPKAQSIADTEKLVMLSADKEYAKQYDDKSSNDFLKQAQAYYAPYEIGTKISIYKTQSLGSNPKVDGKYYGIDSYGLVKIGNSRVPLIDISKRDTARFFPEKAVQLIKNYANGLEYDYNFKKKNILTGIKDKIRKDIYLKYGISLYRNKWIPTTTLVTGLRKQAIQIAMPTKRNALAADIYKNNGYVLTGKKWSHPKIDYKPNDFDYMPKDLAIVDLENLMSAKNISISNSPLAKHPGAKYYDFEF